VQGIFAFDLSVNTRKCGISHNKTSARNRSRARYGFALCSRLLDSGPVPLP
jgi:hypothetical protein